VIRMRKNGGKTSSLSANYADFFKPLLLGVRKGQGGGGQYADTLTGRRHQTTSNSSEERGGTVGGLPQFVQIRLPRLEVGSL